MLLAVVAERAECVLDRYPTIHFAFLGRRQGHAVLRGVRASRDLLHVRLVRGQAELRPELQCFGVIARGGRREGR
jgi:hypothetical protein